MLAEPGLVATTWTTPGCGIVTLATRVSDIAIAVSGSPSGSDASYIRSASSPGARRDRISGWVAVGLDDGDGERCARRAAAAILDRDSDVGRAGAVSDDLDDAGLRDVGVGHARIVRHGERGQRVAVRIGCLEGHVAERARRQLNRRDRVDGRIGVRNLGWCWRLGRCFSRRRRESGRIGRDWRVRRCVGRDRVSVGVGRDRRVCRRIVGTGSVGVSVGPEFRRRGRDRRVCRCVRRDRRIWRRVVGTGVSVGVVRTGVSVGVSSGPACRGRIGRDRRVCRRVVGTGVSGGRRSGPGYPLRVGRDRRIVGVSVGTGVSVGV